MCLLLSLLKEGQADGLPKSIVAMPFRFFVFASLLFFSKNIFGQSANMPTEQVYSSEVYFDFGKHELQPGSDTVFSKIKKLVGDKSGLFVKITAHTDSIGSLQNNLALSQRRGNAVKQRFLEMGIPDSLLQVADFGETKPAATNSTETGRQKNRRATIEILKYQKATAAPKKEPAAILAKPGKIILKGKITDAESGLGLPATVIIRSKERQDTLYTDASGKFEKQLPPGTVVGVDAFSECHFFASQMLKTKPGMPPLELKLKPAKTGKSLDLNKLYFIGGQAKLV
ncbi:MAG TPA: hypothetical protein ENJ95_23565, partial [Bacteroidetes bacterium]|nr:hypothetical protein [Bacteroidota bacterium]